MKLIGKYLDPHFGLQLRKPTTYDEIVNAAEMAGAKRKQLEAAKEAARSRGLDMSKPEIKADNTLSSDKTTTVVRGLPDELEVNPHLGLLNWSAGLGEQMWQLLHPYLNQWRNVSITAPFAVPLGIMVGGGAAGAAGSAFGSAATTTAGRTLLNKGLQFASNKYVSPVLNWGGKGLKWGTRLLNGLFALDAANDISNGKFTPMNALELTPMLHYGVKGTRALNDMYKIHSNPDFAYALKPEALANLPNRFIKGMPEGVRSDLFLDTGNGYVPYSKLTLSNLASNYNLDKILETNKSNGKLDAFIFDRANDTRLYDDLPFLTNWRKLYERVGLDDPYSPSGLLLAPGKYRSTLEGFDKIPIMDAIFKGDTGDYEGFLYPQQRSRLRTALNLKNKGVPEGEIAALDTKLGHKRIPLLSDTDYGGSFTLNDLEYPWQLDRYVPEGYVEPVLNKFGRLASALNGLVFLSKKPIYTAEDLAHLTPEQSKAFASRVPGYGSGASSYLNDWNMSGYDDPQGAAVNHFLSELVQLRDPKLRYLVRQGMLGTFDTRTMPGSMYASHHGDLSIDSYKIAIDRVLKKIASGLARWLTPEERTLVLGLQGNLQVLNPYGLSGRFRGDIPFDSSVSADQIVSADEIAKAFGLKNVGAVRPRYALTSDVDALYNFGHYDNGRPFDVHYYRHNRYAPKLKAITGNDGTISVVDLNGVIYKRYLKPYTETEITDNLNDFLLKTILKYKLDDPSHSLFNKLRAFPVTANWQDGTPFRTLGVGTFGIQAFKQGAKLIPRS